MGAQNVRVLIAVGEFGDEWWSDISKPVRLNCINCRSAMSQALIFIDCPLDPEQFLKPVQFLRGIFVTCSKAPKVAFSNKAKF